jgi:hypothetical protein
MESRIIVERAFTLACRTSIGANVAESQGGQTKPDFVAKTAIARRESWETIYWLKVAIATRHDERGSRPGVGRSATTESNDYGCDQDRTGLAVARRP